MMWFYQMSTTVWDGARSRNNAYEVAVKRWRRLRKRALDARKLAADRAAADGAATSAKWAKAVSQRAAEDAASPYPNPFPIMIPNSAEDRAMLPVSKRAAADSRGSPADRDVGAVLRPRVAPDDAADAPSAISSRRARSRRAVARARCDPSRRRRSHRVHPPRRSTAPRPVASGSSYKGGETRA